MSRTQQGYEVATRDSADAAWEAPLKTSSTELTVGSLDVGTTYMVQSEDGICRRDGF